MKRSILVFLIALLATACSKHADGELIVHDAWIKEAPPGMDMVAGYMDVENAGGTELRIVSVTSDAASEIMMHSSEIVDGVAKMTHLPEVVVAAHSHVLFKPGSYHLMIMGLKHPIKDGDELDLHLHTADGKTVDTVARVRRAE